MRKAKADKMKPKKKRLSNWLRIFDRKRKSVVQIFSDQNDADHATKLLKTNGISASIRHQGILVEKDSSPYAEDRFFLIVYESELDLSAKLLSCRKLQNKGLPVCPSCGSSDIFIPHFFFDKAILGLGRIGVPGRLRKCKKCNFTWRRFSGSSW